MAENRITNYDRVIETWRQKFLDMDQQSLVKKFGLEEDSSALYLRYFTKPMRIDKSTGRISSFDRPGERLGFHEVIAVYNLFYYAADAAKESGRLVPFREVKRVYPFEKAYQRNILEKLQEQFAGRLPLLCAACEGLGGIPMGKSDAGYLLPVFPFLHMALLFWDGDEEFPPKANLLFDENITDFLHEENVVGVAADLVRYLSREAGILMGEIYGA